MSTSPYSIDLREKVIKFIEGGNSQKAAARIFQLSKTTVNIWWLRYKQEGHYCPRKRIGAKPSIEKDKFIKYVEENPSLRACDIGKEFGMGMGGARYWLKQLGFSYKKKPFPMWKQAKRSD